MKTLVKRSAVLLGGAITVIAVAGIATAETRFAVQDATGTVDKMVVTDTGRIGINTSAPEAGVTIKSTIPNDAQIKAHLTTATNYDAAGVAFFKSNPNGGTDKLPLLNDRLGYVLFGGMYGATARNAAGIYGYAGSSWANTLNADWSPAYLAFETTDLNSKTRLERVRIATDGKVGIGTSAPKQKLEINGGVRLNTTAAKPACDATTRGTMWYTQNASSADIFEVCAKIDASNYGWRQLY